MKKPNILFIMTDQQRYDAIGSVSDWVNTPNLNRIASEGIMFNNCVTNSPVCVPARISLATGLYPHNTGIWDNFNVDLSPESRTWMQVIREQGYRTSLFGKTHLHHQNGDLRDREHLIRAYGIDDVYEIGGPWASSRVKSYMTDEWESKALWESYKKDYKERAKNKRYTAKPSPLPLDDYADVHIAGKAGEYLEAYNGEEPWFCWLSFGGPHEPWDAPEPYASMYNPENMPDALPRPAFKEGLPESSLAQKFSEAESYSPPLTDEDIKKLRANYAGSVTLIDEQIGKILNIIEKRGELENTVIAFTSDHGELNGDWGLLYKRCFLKGCLNVPFIIRTPDTSQSRFAGSVNSNPIEMFDLGPTLAELAGGRIDYPQFAKSLVPVLKGEKTQIRNEAVSELNGEVMITGKKWKIAVNKKGQAYMLFGIEKDPEEQNNLAFDPNYNSVILSLKERMLERMLGSQLDKRDSVDI